MPGRKKISVGLRKHVLPAARRGIRMKARSNPISGVTASRARAGVPGRTRPRAETLILPAALIGAGVLLESELLAGIALCTGIALASRWLPDTIGERVKPIVQRTVGACSSAAEKTSKSFVAAARRLERLVA